MEEIWKAIPGYEGLYEASSEGRIRSLDRYSREFDNNGTKCRRIIKGRILKGSHDFDGYVNVDLYDLDHKSPRTYRVHRLIALTFIPNLNNLSQIDHLNGIKDDNRVCNLEWVSCKENINRAWRDGRCHIPPRSQSHNRSIRLSAALKRGRPCKCTDDNIVFLTIHAAGQYYEIPDDRIRYHLLDGKPCRNKDNSQNLHFIFISKDSAEYAESAQQFKNKLLDECDIKQSF